MAQPNDDSPRVAPWSRVAILLISLGVAATIAYWQTGSLLPTSPQDALLFQNGVLLIVLGSAVIEHKFTRPADALVNSLLGAITMVTVYTTAPPRAWWAVFLYCLAVFSAATLCLVVSTGPRIVGARARVAAATYHVAVYFGRARVLYSIVFLFGLIAFYGVQSERTLALVIFWGAFIALWPLRIPEILSGLHRRVAASASVGAVIRTDWPNIIRVALHPSTRWDRDSLKVYQQAGGVQTLVLPLYSHVREDTLIGTGLCVRPCLESLAGLSTGTVYEAATGQRLSEKDIALALGGLDGSKLIGFVIEDSSIASIRFELWDPADCTEGMLVTASVGSERIFYQITDGSTREEAFHSDRHGYQVATAVQVGRADRQLGFVKHTWLPPMNTAVFSVPANCSAELFDVRVDEFHYGTIPQTDIEVGGAFDEALAHHTAILGLTGSGKTELAFDLIRFAVARGVKVICVDLTARYHTRLAELGPLMLAPSDKTTEELSARLSDVETGVYGAGKEKKALNEFAATLRAEADQRLRSFLAEGADAGKLGIITLEEISNTKASLFITEVFLTSLLRIAKETSGDGHKVLVVLEEAHTVVPEAATMGLGDHDSKGLVAKIAQIALQGRKYGVGLLVVAQRTATVSKSILTQCNTVISFSCFDETSLGFLGNVFGRAHTSLLPNLPPLHAVVFGKGVRAERPLVIQVPFDSKKASPTPTTPIPRGAAVRDDGAASSE